MSSSLSSGPSQSKRQNIVIDLSDDSSDDVTVARESDSLEQRHVKTQNGSTGRTIVNLDDDSDSDLEVSLKSRLSKKRKRIRRLPDSSEDEEDRKQAIVTNGRSTSSRDNRDSGGSSIYFSDDAIDVRDTDYEAALEASRRESATATPLIPANSQYDLEGIDFDEPFEEPESDPHPVKHETVTFDPRSESPVVWDDSVDLLLCSEEVKHVLNDKIRPTTDPMPPFPGVILCAGDKKRKIPRNNLQQMIEYVQTFSLEGRIRQLNPGKEIDMKKLKQNIDCETEKENETFTREAGVYDRPSPSVPFVFEPPPNYQPDGDEPIRRSAVTSNGTSAPESASKTIDLSDLENIDWSEDIMEVDDESVIPAPGKNNVPFCSSPKPGPSNRVSVEFGKHSEDAVLARHFRSIENTPPADTSYHEYEQNCANEPELKIDNKYTADILYNLREVFKMESFRKNQREIMNAALLEKDDLPGHDVFVLMPTGGGKSLCYQLPALIKPGITIVISPLKSLIYDQVTKLEALGISVAHLSGDMSKSEVREVYKGIQQNPPAYKLLYVTPERISASPAMKDIFKKMYANGVIDRFVVDEAHCVSQWGHDFRPDYKKLGILKKEFPKVPIMAVTATANKRVRVDVCAALNIGSAKWFIQSFNRTNLKYEVREKRKDSEEEMIDIIRAKFLSESGIIYCFSRNDCSRMAGSLRKAGIKAQAYHAGLTDVQRTSVQSSWLSGKSKVICATIAFGMGIDKADVRYVFHFCVPKSMEGYYQEAGRAGRAENWPTVFSTTLVVMSYD